MAKQSKPLQTRYDTTYIYDRYYIRTHVYNTIITCLKRVGYGGYEWEEKEMCRFAGDMS